MKNILIIGSTGQIGSELWPNSLDDSCAREEWGWNPKFDLEAMTKDMLEKLTVKLMQNG
jgi:nucleoside-diphosphate-sugar epimerase